MSDNFMKNEIIDNITASIEAKRKMIENNELLDKVALVAQKIIDAYLAGNKVLVCGNGGSASDAQHFVGELVGRYLMERKGIPAIALTANSTVVTALGNDYSYEEIFSKQVVALGSKGDILISISTSGNSKDCVKASEIAKEKGIYTVAFTGKNGGKLLELCDVTLNVESVETPRIQESHICLIHTICGIVEKKLMEAGFFNE